MLLSISDFKGNNIQKNTVSVGGSLATVRWRFSYVTFCLKETVTENGSFIFFFFL